MIIRVVLGKKRWYHVALGDHQFAQLARLRHYLDCGEYRRADVDVVCVWKDRLASVQMVELAAQNEFDTIAPETLNVHSQEIRQQFETLRLSVSIQIQNEKLRRKEIQNVDVSIGNKNLIPETARKEVGA